MGNGPTDKSDLAWDVTDAGGFTPYRRGRAAALALAGVLVLAAAFWLLSERLAGGPSPSDAVADALCGLQEAREGSGFEKWEGLDLEFVQELAARQGLRVRVVERSTQDGSPTAGRPVIEISRCATEATGTIRAVVPAGVGP